LLPGIEANIRLREARNRIKEKCTLDQNVAVWEHVAHVGLLEGSLLRLGRLNISALRSIDISLEKRMMLIFNTGNIMGNTTHRFGTLSGNFFCLLVVF
jgi:hypothetical protein